jgi:hypothetical protein
MDQPLLITALDCQLAERHARLQVVWSMTIDERVAAMRAGKLTLEQCAAWAARFPHEVPLLNGEFEFLAASTPEVLE